MSDSPLAKDPRRIREIFRMPAVQTMKSRKTSITNAFVSAIVPVVHPTDDEILEALKLLGMTTDSVECIYCGDKHSAWDHLRPIVGRRRPTGYISEIANLVPSCQPCNSSKGNSYWKTWMLGDAPKSPKRRRVALLDERVARLEAYEHWRQPTCVDFEAILGSDVYAGYWRELDRIIGELEHSQEMADKLRAAVHEASTKWQPRPLTETADSTPEEGGSNAQ